MSRTRDAGSLPFVGFEVVEIPMTASELAVITRPLVGEGGHQQLLQECLRTRRGNTLYLSGQVLHHVEKYAWTYGSGGYQGRFRTIVAAARRSGWTG